MFSAARWYDLLHTEVYVRLLSEPATFRREVEGLAEAGWVVVDEVQRVPALLNEVHSLIARFGDRWRFALCGSSARKLKRLDVNLLAGRAINRAFFPLTWNELNAELRAHLAIHNRGGELSYYRTGAGAEVDFIWRGPEITVSIEVKSSARWRPEHGAVLKELMERKAIQRAYAVFDGEAVQQDGPVRVLPVREFCARLSELLD